MAKTSIQKTILSASNLTVPNPQLADGIYIGLSSAVYHAQDALGSSGIRDLLKGANLFWHKSRMNPNRPKEKKTPSTILGTATHRLLLDGIVAFNADYIRGPYGPDDDLTSAEKSALTKAAKARLMEDQELLSQEEYNFVLGCSDVLNADPKLQGCLDNGLSEVSIFWTRADGVRCKARHDKLKIRGIGDIKTIANEKERPLDEACRLDIKTYRYDIPAEHYMEGRRQMARLFAKGDVFFGDQAEPISEASRKDKDGTDKVLKFLHDCIEQKTFGFQFVFIPKKGAPDAWSCTLSPGNPILEGARQDIETAIHIYKKAKAEYGTSRWLPGHDVDELDIADLPMGFGRRR